MEYNAAVKEKGGGARHMNRGQSQGTISKERGASKLRFTDSRGQRMHMRVTSGRGHKKPVTVPALRTGDGAGGEGFSLVSFEHFDFHARNIYHLFKNLAAPYF